MSIFFGSPAQAGAQPNQELWIPAFAGELTAA